MQCQREQRVGGGGAASGRRRGGGGALLGPLCRSGATAKHRSVYDRAPQTPRAAPQPTATARPGAGAAGAGATAPVVLAPLIFDVDHFFGFMIATMRRSFPLDAETWSREAPVTLAPFIDDVEHCD
jgi:hypothetical protein